MKKEIQYSIYTFACFLTILWLAKPFREYLQTSGVAQLNAKLVAGIIMRLVIILLALLVILKLNFKSYNGIKKINAIQNPQALIIPSIFILGGLANNWNTYTSTSTYILFLFTSSVIIVGFAEELVFRGIILPLFLKYFRNKKNVLFLGVIASSLIFGMIHYVNLLREPGNFWGITNQVFFALSIGVFFGGLMLRTRSILIPVVIHGLVNFSFGTGELKTNEIKVISEKVADGINWGSVIPTTLFFAFIFASGIYMIRKSDKDFILNNLNQLLNKG